MIFNHIPRTFYYYYSFLHFLSFNSLSNTQTLSLTLSHSLTDISFSPSYNLTLALTHSVSNTYTPSPSHCYTIALLHYYTFALSHSCNLQSYLLLFTLSPWAYIASAQRGYMLWLCKGWKILTFTPLQKAKFMAKDNVYSPH